MSITETEAQRRYEAQPPLAPGRPPTRREVWNYVKHWYGDLKTDDELKAFARNLFVGNYVYYVNFLGWTYPPEWVEGEPVVEAARPSRPFPAGEGHQDEVYRLLALQKGE